MARATHKSLVSTSVISGLIGLALLPATPAFANGGDRAWSYDNGLPNEEPGVAIGDDVNQQPANPNAVSNIFQDEKSVGPVRMARFAYVNGNVTWRGDDNSDWSPATTNLPLREGAQIWVTDGGRAEIQFDDGSVLRLGNGAVVTLQMLYSDADGEFTEIKLNDGLASLRLKNNQSVYQVDTPLASIKANGPARFRLGVDNGIEVAVQEGRATVEGPQGKVALAAGNYLDLRDAQAAFEVGSLPAKDSWDLWNDERDEIFDDSRRPAAQYLPPNIALVAGDLDDYGTWHDDPNYGHVWCPHVADHDWRPYHEGHWTWVVPFGWTWVADEPWGWAPYHYGTWIYQPYGWAWVPGPSHQYWCPAVVHFSEYNGQIAWCPLAPVEVRYPALISVGFRTGNWATMFSIGQAGVYYASDRTYCVARPFSTTYVNHVMYIKHIDNITSVTNVNTPSYNRYLSSAEGAAANRSNYNTNRRFIPINAVKAAGASVATVAEFGGRGGYRALPKSSQAYFAEGKTADAPPADVAPVAGPIAARPTFAALTPTRTYVQNNQPTRSVMQRTVFASALPPQVQRAKPAATATTSGSTAASGRPDTRSRTGITTLPAERTTVTGVRTAPSDRSSSPVVRTGSSPTRPGASDPGAATGARRSGGSDNKAGTGAGSPKTGASNGSGGGDRAPAPRKQMTAAERAAGARASLGLPGGQGAGNPVVDRNVRPGTSNPAPSNPAPSNPPSRQPSRPADPTGPNQPTVRQESQRASEPARPSQPPTYRPEPTRPEPPRQEPARSEPPRPQPSRPEPPRPEPPRQEPARPQPSRSEPPQRQPERNDDKSKDSSKDGRRGH